MKSTQSLIHFLDKLIDYAGLFPPAKLAIEPSLNNYSTYIQSPDSWIMSQFIIPVSRLKEIPTDVMESYSENNPLRLSLISADICSEIDTVHQFLDEYGDSTCFTGYESRISDLPAFSQTLLDVHQLCKSQNLNFDSFYEVSPHDNWVNQMNEAVSKISAFNTEYKTKVGFKLRCGGVEAHMFPSAEDIASAVLACRDADVSMKFTAGLHHPIRHYNESVKTKMYGFFNVFIGGMIAHKFDLDLAELVPILLDENSDRFLFDENGLSWKKYSISNAEIVKYRQESFISYGSCSFNEPREDLQKLGLF
ncbi:MAG: hypothetical protein H8E72_08745 [Candidatus Marinimicrobia bacterium]|nr:hypothetical protein [Candidatus Neomarinimicrobiota bacterium]